VAHVSWVLLGIGASICTATSIGFAGRWWWLFDVFAHFRVQYALAAAALTLVCAWQRRPAWAGIMAACLAANVAVMHPYLNLAQGARAGETPSDSATVRAITMNVWYRNRSYAAAERFIRESWPDFVLGVEMTPAWRRALASLRDILPYTVPAPRAGTSGLVLYSTHPCLRCEILDIGDVGLPAVVGEFRVGGRTLTIVGAHFTVPLGPAHAHLMARHVAAVGDYVRALPGPVVLLGDLNTTPWSHYFRDLRARSGLRDSALGRGIQPTWPAWWRIPMVTIDHALVSNDIQFVDRQVGPPIGSDHRPVIVDFTIGDDTTPRTGK
jgi:endonuclease/exonuclease/phosphatase (EEP) superfamily protein YafD